MKKKRRSGLRILIIVFAVLILLVTGARLWLPHYLKERIDHRLSMGIDGYKGIIDNIEVNTLSGSYSINNIRISKATGKIPAPFFTAERMELSVHWSTLLKGAIVGDLKIQRPQLNFVQGTTDATSQTTIGPEWKEAITELLPFRINSFEVSDGEIHYDNLSCDPPVALQINEVHLRAINLTNADGAERSLPSTVEGEARLYEGTLKVKMHINPLQRTPTFSMNATLTEMKLQDLNDFFKAYGNFDVQKGVFSLYTEAATRDNKIRGFVKPSVKDVKATTWKRNEEGLVMAASLNDNAPLAIWAFANQRRGSVNRIEFEGDISKTNADLFSIVGETMKTAFIEALMPAIRNSITVRKPERAIMRTANVPEEVKTGEEKKDGLLKRLFGKKNNETEKKKKERKKSK